MIQSKKYVTISLAKRLQKAGFPQTNSERYWRNDHADNDKNPYRWEIIYADNFPLYGTPHFVEYDGNVYLIAAPDAQEIGALLPGWFLTSREFGQVEGMPRVPGFIQAMSEKSKKGMTEVGIRAEAWLWLKAQNLI